MRKLLQAFCLPALLLASVPALSQLTVNAGSDKTICTGVSTTLTTSVSNTGGNPVTYSWSPATGLSAANVANPVASPTTTTTYTVTATIPGPLTTITYSQNFTLSTTPGAQCTAWNTFRNSLSAANYYTKVTIRGSRDATGVSITDPATVQQIAAALRAGTNGAWTSGGRSWEVGNCGSGIELSASGTLCQCSTGYIVRPCIGNGNWGGVNGLTCGAPTQTMIVDFQYAGQIASDQVVVNIGSVTATTAVTQPSCAGSTNGAIVLTPSGGTAPYTYNWGGGITTKDRSGIGAGTYTVNITDANGCTATATATLTDPVVPVVNVPADQNVCAGSSVAVNFTGTAANYTWTNSNTAIGLAASGTGNIASFTATNATTAPVTATVTVTPQTANTYAYIANYATANVRVIDVATRATVANISTGSGPHSITISPDGSRVYTANQNGSSVSVINTATNTLVTNITGFSGPLHTAVSPDGTRLYVPNFAGNTVSVVNTATNAIVGSIPVQNSPFGMTVLPGGTRGYVANWASASVSVVNLTTNTLIQNIAVGSNPSDIVQSPDASRIYVAARSANLVYVINTTTNAVVGTIATGAGPFGIAISPDGTRLYTANQAGNSVSVLNATTLSFISNIPVGSNPSAVSVTPDGTQLWAANTNSNTVSVIDLSSNTVTNTITGLASPYTIGNFIKALTACTGTPQTFTITVNPQPAASISYSGSPFCATGTATPTLTGTTGGSYSSTAGLGIDATTGAINLAASTPGTYTVTYTIPASGGCAAVNATAAVTVNAVPTVNDPADITACAGTTLTPAAFTGTASSYTWTNNNTAIGLAASGTGNLGAFTPTNATNAPITATVTVTPVNAAEYAYVAGGIGVSLINLRTNAQESVINTGGSGPFGIAVAPNGSYAYVANQATDNVSVINTNTNTVVATIPVGTTPYGIAVSPNGSRVYVVNSNSNTVSVINTVTNTVMATIPVGSSAIGVAVSPDGTKIYVANRGSNTVTVIDAATNTVTATLGNVNGPFGIVFSPNGTRAYVTNQFGGGVSVFNAATNAFITTIPAGAEPRGIAVTPNGSLLYVANRLSNNVTVINTGTNTVVASIPAGTEPFGVSVSGDGSKAYVANFTTADLTVINTATNTVNTTVTTGGNLLIGFGNFVKPASNCAGTPQTFTLTVNPQPAATIAYGSGAFCRTGTVTPTFTGTTGGSYSSTAGLSINATTGAIDLAASTAGTYTVTYTIPAANGCSQVQATTSVTINPLPTASTVAFSVTCFGGSNGTINLTPAGGTPPYTYLWNNGVATEDNIGLAAGSYSVTVTDSKGCQVTLSNIVVGQSAAPVSGSTVVTNVACFGGTNGAINLTPAGGTPPYTFNWGGGVTTEDRTGLAAGSYSVTITDANGCTRVVNVTVGQPATAVSGTTVTVNPTCNGGTNGSIDLTPAGGTPPYTYLWNGGATTQDRTGLAAGTYTVTITDGNGCTATVAATLSNPAPVTVNAVTSQTLCSGTGTTAISFSGSAGASFNWTNNNTAIGLAAGGTGNIPAFTAVNSTGTTQVATITVTPVNGSCSGTPTTFTITVNPEPSATFSYSGSPYCSGAGTATPTVSGTSGGTFTSTAGLSINATTGAVNIGTSTPGTYTVTYTVAASGPCPQFTTTASITISAPATTTINASGPLTICSGSSVTLSVPAGATSYLWSNGATTNSITVSTAGNYSVTVTSGACVATGGPVTVSVNPVPTVTAVASQNLCNGASTTAIAFSGGVPGTVYNWTNSNAAIGLAAGGSGNIASFAAVNNGSTPVTATITVTPSFTNGGTTCTGTPATFAITVNPTPTVNNIASQTVCATGATTAVTFSGTVANTTYSWTNNTPAIGLAAAGTGNIPSFAGINNTNAPVTATITVTPQGNLSGRAYVPNNTAGTVSVIDLATGTVVGSPITVGANPFGVAVTPDRSKVFVSNTGGNSVSVIDAATNTVVATSPYNAPHGLVASPDGTRVYVNGWTNNAVSFIPTATPNTSTFIANVTQPEGMAVSADGSRLYVASSTSPGNLVVINTVSGTVAATVPVGNFPQGVAISTDGSKVYVVNNGSGNVSVVNTATNAVSATIPVGSAPLGAAVSPDGTKLYVTNSGNDNVSVISTATNAVSASIAVGTFPYGIAVAPDGSAVYVANKNSNNVSVINAATNAVSSVAVGNGPIALGAFTTASLQCNGAPKTFTITVNPTPTVNTVASQTVCNGANTTAVNFNGAVTGTVYSWTNSNPAIGLAATGSGNIAAFTAINPTNAPVTATITVTPSFTNNGTTCTGTPVTFTITVNPTPSVSAPASQVLCAGGSSAAVSFSGTVAGATYSWTNSNASIGLAASGSGNIAAFTAVNNTASVQTATITVTPSANSCAGTPVTFTITVNPTPSVNAVAGQTVCNGASTTAVSFAGAVTGTVYSWSNSNPAIGLGASGTGTIAAFTATNTTNAPLVATITVTPSYTNGGTTCTGTPATFTITVNPTPSVSAPSSQAVCAGAATTAVNFAGTVAGATYSWTNSNTAIGLAASGTGNIASFTATNSTATVQTATISVTPAANGCTGTPVTFTITVNPTPTVNTLTAQALCNGAPSIAVNFSGAVAGTVYSWTNTNSSIGLGAAGTGNIPVFTATNTTNAPVTATITVAPSFTNGGQTCTGTAGTFTITVNPTPSVTAPAAQVLCNGATTAAVTFAGPVAGTTYTWTNSTTSIGLAATGTGDIAAFTATNNGSTPVTATITVTPSANGCAGTPQTFTITVNPTPTVDAITVAPVCAGQTVNVPAFSGAVSGTTYSWTNSNPSIGLAASGTGAIPAFTATNNGSSALTGTVTVTPGANGCTGAPVTFPITVNPPLTITITAPNGTLICQGAPVLLQASGAATYQWLLNGAPIAGATGATYNATQAGTYSVNAVNASGCTAVSNTITTTLVAQPRAAFSFNSYCQGVPVQFTNSTNTSGAGTVTYQWNFGNGQTATTAAPTATYTAPGTYTVQLVASPNGCTALNDTARQTITIEAPLPGRRLDPQNVVAGVPTQLQARNLPNGHYSWTPTTGLSNPLIFYPVATLSLETDYRIAVSFASGCVTVDSLLVRIFSGNDIFVPTAFSPNGDGTNDRLRPVMVGIASLRRFAIFDRMGRELFSTSSSTQGWDGMFMGKQLPADTYLWVVEGTDRNGATIRKQGQVLLVR